MNSYSAYIDMTNGSKGSIYYEPTSAETLNQSTDDWKCYAPTLERGVSCGTVEEALAPVDDWKNWKCYAPTLERGVSCGTVEEALAPVDDWKNWKCYAPTLERGVSCGSEVDECLSSDFQRDRGIACGSLDEALNLGYQLETPIVSEWHWP